MTTPSPSPEVLTRTRDLISLTDRLTGLIAGQARCFEEHRPHDAAAAMEEVSRLANIYRHESARIRQNPALLGVLPDGLRRDLTRATEAFDAVLARQSRAVTAAKEITEGLVRAIAHEVARQRSDTGAGYGPSAAKPGAATAITLNRRA